MKRNNIVFITLCVLFLGGCSAGYMTNYTYDPKSGIKTKTIYSPLYSTESVVLAEGAEFRVSVVNARRVEPISHGLLSAMGGLTLDDLESNATVEIHFKNDSQNTYKIDLEKFAVLNSEIIMKLPEVILKSGDHFNTRQVAIKIPTYGTTFALKLFYKLNGQSSSKSFFMQRATMEELGNRKNKK